MAERELRTTEDVFDENMRLAELERNRLKGINNPTKKPKPFYISELPEKAQNWIKERTKKNFLKDGMSEKEAEQRANDFLDEKVYTAEETFGKDFWKSFEDTNDKSLDAIKDNFTPPGAKGKSLEDIDQTYEGKNKEIMKDLEKDGWAMTPFSDRADHFKEQGYDVENKGGVYMIKPKSSTPPGAKGEEDYELYDQMESMGDLPSDMQLHKALKKADTNDNGKIEVDEMADFQKSLDDYAAKNKKGRDDIPVTTRR